MSGGDNGRGLGPGGGGEGRACAVPTQVCSLASGFKLSVIVNLGDLMAFPRLYGCGCFANSNVSLEVGPFVVALPRKNREVEGRYETDALAGGQRARRRLSRVRKYAGFVDVVGNGV